MTASFGIAGAGLAIIIVIAQFIIRGLDRRHREKEVKSWDEYVKTPKPRTQDRAGNAAGAGEGPISIRTGSVIEMGTF